MSVLNTGLAKTSTGGYEIDNSLRFNRDDGAYFSKSIHITFQYCRHLRIILDQSELHRIGSKHFRPDIQVRSCFVEHVYHLELLQNHGGLMRQSDAKDDRFGKFINNYVIDEYARDTADLDLTIFSVALVKLDVDANFTSLVTSTPESMLYIDLTSAAEGHKGNKHDDVNVKGFLKQNIYFLTDEKQRIPLKQVIQNQ